MNFGQCFYKVYTWYFSVKMVYILSIFNKKNILKLKSEKNVSNKNIFCFFEGFKLRWTHYKTA